MSNKNTVFMMHLEEGFNNEAKIVAAMIGISKAELIRIALRKYMDELNYTYSMKEGEKKYENARR